MPLWFAYAGLGRCGSLRDPSGEQVAIAASEWRRQSRHSVTARASRRGPRTSEPEDVLAAIDLQKQKAGIWGAWIDAQQIGCGGGAGEQAVVNRARRHFVRSAFGKVRPKIESRQPALRIVTADEGARASEDWHQVVCERQDRSFGFVLFGAREWSRRFRFHGAVR